VPVGLLGVPSGLRRWRWVFLGEMEVEAGLGRARGLVPGVLETLVRPGGHAGQRQRAKNEAGVPSWRGRFTKGDRTAQIRKPA
jgi:hypothetical protein